MEVPRNHDTEQPERDRDPRLSRLTRLRHARSWNSPGPIGGFAAASIAGFEPVGQVFGTTVACPGPPAFDRCYATGSASRTNPTADPYNPLLAWNHAAREVALERAVAECRELGGDGIIGMRMTSTRFLSNTVEFTVEGTAVRAPSSVRPAVPFTTHVSGQDLAKLLRSGWMPFALVYGLAIASSHFDGSMFQHTRRGIGDAGNREVFGYTRLVNDARREARRVLENAVRDHGGQGAVVQEMTQRFSDRECPLVTERSDYMVEATILGSAIVSFERNEPTARQTPLAIMRLDRGPKSGAGSGPSLAEGPSLGDRAVAYWAARRDAQEGTADGD